MTTLVKLSTAGVLLRDAAASFERALADLFTRAGIRSGTTRSSHATRTDAEQVAIFERYYTRDSSQPLYSPVDRRVWQGRPYYRRAGFPSAAIPGTSNHGRGDTVDWQNLGGYGSYSWNRAAAILREHGWNNDEGRRVGEPWHWTYVKADDKHLTTSSTARKEDDMRHDYTTNTQPLVGNRWETIKVTDKGGVSVGFGACEADATVTIHINAPAGTQMRFRFYKINYKTGKRTYTYDIESKFDSPETKGSTMCLTARFVAELHKNERLRLEGYTWEDPGKVKITSAAYRTKED